MSRPQWCVWIAFDAHLRDEDVARKVFEELSEAGLTTEKIDEVEPLRQDYSEEALRSFLSRSGRTYPCVALSGRGDKFRLEMRACDSTAADVGAVNVLSLVSDATMASRRIGPLDEMCKRLLASGLAAYAYADWRTARDRQRSPGTILDRLPGIYWMNLLSAKYVEALGHSRITSAPWHHMKPIDGGVQCFLYEDALQPPADVDERCRAVKAVLGVEWFERGGSDELPKLATSRSIN